MIAKYVATELAKDYKHPGTLAILSPVVYDVLDKEKALDAAREAGLITQEKGNAPLRGVFLCAEPRYGHEQFRSVSGSTPT